MTAAAPIAAPRTSWLVLVAATIGLFMTTPGQTVGVSAFVDRIAWDLALTREQILLLYSLGTLIGILPAPFIGRLADRRGPRTLLPLIAVALGGACFAIAWAQGAWSLAVGFILLRGVAIGGLSLVSLHMVMLWFDRWRGRATSIAMMGLAAGGLVVPRLAEQLSAFYGWRISYMILGAGVAVVMTPVALAFSRNRPQSYGLLPDPGLQGQEPVRESRPSLTLSDARRTLALWYLLSIAILANAVGTALLLDHVRVMVSASIPRDGAVALLGGVALVQAGAMLLGGALVDRIGAIRTGIVGLSILLFTVVLLAAKPSLGAGFAYTAAFGSMLGIMHVVPGAGFAEQFGTRHIGAIRGVSSSIGVFGAAAGPVPMAISANVAYATFAAGAALALALGVFLALGSDRRRVRRP